MSTRPPRVSVLMPAYNAEKYIDDSVQSILNQTFTDFELLILDDASQDNTYHKAKVWAKKDSRVKVFRNEKNLNIASSRNKLIKLSQGEYIAWQDADDISVPERLQLQFEFLTKHPKVGIVGGFLEFFDDRGTQTIRQYEATDQQLRQKIFFFSPIAQPTAMIRREALDKAGEYGHDLSPAEDIEMSFRIGSHYEFANLQQVTLKYRNYSASSTYRKLRKIEWVTIKTRFKFAAHPRYHMTFLSFLYNLGQLLSIMLVPISWKIKLFNWFRNSGSYEQ